MPRIDETLEQEIRYHLHCNPRLRRLEQEWRLYDKMGSRQVLDAIHDELKVHHIFAHRRSA